MLWGANVLYIETLREFFCNNEGGMSRNYRPDTENYFVNTKEIANHVDLNYEAEVIRLPVVFFCSYHSKGEQWSSSIFSTDYSSRAGWNAPGYHNDDETVLGWATVRKVIIWWRPKNAEAHEQGQVSAHKYMNGFYCLIFSLISLKRWV